MSFLTKVITDTSPDFGDNPQTATENDRPASVEVDGLVSNTGYWTKAEIWQNGVLNDTSEVKTFTTLPAGTITLEHISTTRSGYGYDVAYRYTSTYAPSSAILSTNGTQFQGFIDSAQHAVSFWVTGLTAGNAYLTNVTLYDIYSESTTVMGSIVATVVNEVRITGTDAHETSVDCELDYVVDEGFTTGWVDYWLGSDDPTQTQPQGHFYFNDGDETCTVSGLTFGTSYKFRATIVLGDGTTEIVSNVVTVSTSTIDYFRITNEYSSNNEIWVYYNGYKTTSRRNLEYSTDEGVTWTEITTFRSNGTTQSNRCATLSRGRSIIFRGDFTYGSSTGYNTIYFGPKQKYSVSGNLFTLTRRSVIEAGNKSSITSADLNEFAGLFAESTNLIDCSNLSINGITAVGQNGFYQTFKNCSSLTNTPDFSRVRSVGVNGFGYAFYGCALVNAPNFSHVASVDEKGFDYAFTACRRITVTPNFSRVRSVGANGFRYAFSGCYEISTIYAPSINEWNESDFSFWVNNVAATGTLYKPASLTIPTGKNGVPSGWTTQDY